MGKKSQILSADIQPTSESWDGWNTRDRQKKERWKKRLILTVELLAALDGIDWSRLLAGDVGLVGIDRELEEPVPVFEALGVPALVVVTTTVVVFAIVCGVWTTVIELLVELIPEVELTTTLPTNWLEWLVLVAETTTEVGCCCRVEEEIVETRGWEELTTWLLLLLFRDKVAEVVDTEEEGGLLVGSSCCCAMDMVVVATVEGTTVVPVAAAVGGAGDIPTRNSWYCPLSVFNSEGDLSTMNNASIVQDWKHEICSFIEMIEQIYVENLCETTHDT